MKQRYVFLGVVAALVSAHPLAAKDYKPTAVWKVGGVVFDVAFSPDGRTLSAGIGWLDQTRDISPRGSEGSISTFSSEVRVFDIATGKTNFRIQGDPPHLGLRFSPDGKTLAAGGPTEGKGNNLFSAGIVKIWEADTGKERLSFDQDRLITCIAFSPDSRVLVTGNFGKTLTLLDLVKGKDVAVLGCDRSVECVAFSPDGKTVASGGYDHVVHLWDVATKKEMSKLQFAENWVPGTGVFALAFTPDGKRLACGMDDGVQIWDVGAKRLVSTLKGKRCSALSFRTEGDLLAWQSADHVVHLWDVKQGRERAQFKGHTDHVYAVTFSPDGKTLVTGGMDKTIKFWNVAGPRLR